MTVAALSDPGDFLPAQTGTNRPGSLAAWFCYKETASFLWHVSLFLTLSLTVGNLLITDCSGIDLKFQPSEKLSHPLDSWPGGERG